MSMASSTLVEETRRALGPVGAFLPVPTTSAPSIDLQRDAVRRLERAGYRTAWTNETVGGKDALVQLAVLMAATERMAFGTGVASIWARSPQTMHGAAALLAQAYPGRFVLGLGVGYPEQAASVGREFGRPLATMRDYLGRMGAPTQLPAPDVAYPGSSAPTAERCSRWPQSSPTGRCLPCSRPSSPPRPGRRSARTSS
jgi:alkanesulfonate monooxygenase SsuD/methylene tetrahydromethanopterin reductase-like flavin-dependent oxidoreductase (luciferase family)